MMQIDSQVYMPGPARFDMCGQSLPTHLGLTEEKISNGLAERLLKYAKRSLDAEGFLEVVSNWVVTVGSDEADESPADRSYWVTWTNPKGASLSVVGILTSRGWPKLDHGMQLERA